jgi:hypothetical protein
MIPSDAHPGVNITFGDAVGDDHLLIRVGNDQACNLHRISLAQARVLSLDIIKQVNRLERLQRLNSQNPDVAPVQAFSFR